MADDLGKGHHSERRTTCHDRLIGPIKAHEYELQEWGSWEGYYAPRQDVKGGVDGRAG